MGWKKMLVGEKMPDKDDPQYRQRYETEVKAIAKEEADYANYKIPKFYTFPSKDAKERILYQNFVSVNLDVKNMIDDINQFKVK
mgnify:CR=1 FL=1